MKIRNILGLLFTLPVLFVACGDDSDITPNPPVPEIVTEPTVLNVPQTSTFVLSATDPSQEVFKLTWTPDVHRLENPVFDVQIDLSGNNFNNVQSLAKVTAYEYSVTAENLDAVIVKKLKQIVNSPQKYDIRVVTMQGSAVIESSASNIYSPTITAYSGYPATLYLAIKGQDITTAPQFTNTADGVFNLVLDLQGGEEYKFVQVQELGKLPEYIASSVVVDQEADILDGTGVYSPKFEGVKSTYNIVVDFTTKKTVIHYNFPENLYLVGSINNWDVENAPAFTKVSEGVFEIIRDLQPNDEFKYVQEQSWNKPDFISSSTEVGVEADLLPGNGSNSPKFAGSTASYKILVDFNAMKTKITAALPGNLYLTGDAYRGWSWEAGNYAQLIPINGTPGTFWTVIYLKKGGFKFSPVSDWIGDFGISTENTDAIGEYTFGSNNINVATEGYYQILVNAGAKTISITTPKVVLKGDAASAGWDANYSTDPFTIDPTNKMQMISPAFAKDAELRMYVEFPGIDWWKSEFIVLDGKIVYRGNDGDQQRVNVVKGGHITLNFDAGTGAIQ